MKRAMVWATGLGCWLAGGVAQANTITWQRVDAANQPAPWVVTPGQVILTRVPSGLPEGMTAQQLAIKLAQQERDLLALQQQQHLVQTETKEYARQQAELARAEAAHVAAVVAEISATRVKANEVAEIAAQQVAEAKPEFQALALQTLGSAKPYLQTIARSAVADADPGMQQALGAAVGKALAAEDSPAAFSMRKAIVDELAAVSQGAISATDPAARTRLGDDVEPSAGPGEALDAARLRLGRLLEPGAGPAVASLANRPSAAERSLSLQRARTRTDLMNLRDYKVVVHEDGQTLPQMLEKIIARAEPFTGPWEVRWKLKPENQDLMTEKFSLDAETTFAEFVSYLAQYLLNDRGVKLSFALFDRERVVLVSD